MVQIYNPSSVEVEAGGAAVEGHPWLHNEFEANCATKGCFKTKPNNSKPLPNCLAKWLNHSALPTATLQSFCCSPHWLAPVVFWSILCLSLSIELSPTVLISIFWTCMMWVVFFHAWLPSLRLLHWSISMSWSCFTCGVFISSLLNLSPHEFWTMVFDCYKQFLLLWSSNSHFLHTVFFIFSVIFFHGSCLLYCTFKVIAKSPKIRLLLAYRNFHFNFRVIIYFETIFMNICFQNLAPSLKGLFFARDKLTVFLSLLWVPFVFCWSIGLVFREFHCPDDCSLTDSHVTSSTLFFYFISSVLVIMNLLPFYEHFRISPLTSVKRLAGTLNWMALSL